jgi:hypothetical protein
MVKRMTAERYQQLRNDFRHDVIGPQPLSEFEHNERFKAMLRPRPWSRDTHEVAVKLFCQRYGIDYFGGRKNHKKEPLERGPKPPRAVTLWAARPDRATPQVVLWYARIARPHGLLVANQFWRDHREHPSLDWCYRRWLMNCQLHSSFYAGDEAATVRWSLPLDWDGTSKHHISITSWAPVEEEPAHIEPYRVVCAATADPFLRATWVRERDFPIYKPPTKLPTCSKPVPPPAGP